MKQKDLMYYGNVHALFAMCYYMDEMLGDIEGDLPEMLEEPYRELKASVHAMMESMETYRKAEKDTFLSACED